MTQYDKQLEELRQQIAKKTRLENILKNLDVQRQELFDRVSELEQIMEKEQADVDKLNRRSLAAFYYSVMGKKESILDKEQQEAYAARVKYDTALSELNAVDSDIQKSKTELLSIQRSEQQYQEILQKKTAFLKASGNADATEILEFEKQLTALNSELEEIQEAIAAGKSAMMTIDHILKHLDDAEGWGTWDMFGGGIISDMAKHDALDRAQDLVEQLQIELRRFKTELTDVSIDANLQISIDGFMRFADFFFDGFFADWTVMEQIDQSKQQVLQTKRELKTVLNRLKTMQTTANRRKETTKYKLDNYVYEH